MRVMLNVERRNSFQRYMRDKKGNRLRKLVFEPRESVELTDEEYEAIEADIGGALVVVNEDGDPDAKGTADVQNGDVNSNEEITLINQSMIPEPLQAKLIKEGIEKLSQLAVIIDEHGPEWYKTVRGIGEPSAKDIVEALKHHEVE